MRKANEENSLHWLWSKLSADRLHLFRLNVQNQCSDIWRKLITPYLEEHGIWCDMNMYIFCVMVYGLFGFEAVH